MKAKQKPCPFCGAMFERDPRARVQKCCGRAECHRARKRQNLKRWRVLHPDHSERYKGKERAWAKAYPDYWQRYRAANPEYAARDNLRRVRSRRRAKLSANETGMRQIVVEKLHAMDRCGVPGVSANETGFLRRVSAIEDCLRSTVAMTLSARRNRVEIVAGHGP
jgi:ferric-dicitrate binding protein FerR (iron transport regulator)